MPLEPNASLQTYAQPRCLLTNLNNVAVPSVGEACLLDASDGNPLPPGEIYRALITSNAHI